MNLASRGAHARIYSISGPVLKARGRGHSCCARRSGSAPQRLLGEVIRLNEDEIVAQVYEDTTGLRPGDRVTGTG